MDPRRAAVAQETFAAHRYQAWPHFCVIFMFVSDAPDAHQSLFRLAGAAKKQKRGATEVVASRIGAEATDCSPSQGRRAHRIRVDAEKAEGGE